MAATGWAGSGAAGVDTTGGEGAAGSQPADGAFRRAGADPRRAGADPRRAGADPRRAKAEALQATTALARARTLVDDLLELDRPGPLLLVVDFDGTIAEIDPHPMGATILPLARRALRRLGAIASERPDRLVVAILSGRTAADVARRVRVGGLLYLGNHGNEGGSLPRRAPAERLVVTPERELVPFVGRARRLGEGVAAELARLWAAEGVGGNPVEGAARSSGGGSGPGELRSEGESASEAAGPLPPPWLYVEDKGPAVAFHYRTAPDATAALAALDRAIVRAAEAGLTAGFRRLDGRLVVEFQPERTIDKGEAVARLIDRLHPGSAVVLGDDRSDALAFTVIREARRSGRLAAALAIAVEGGREVPPEVRAAADLVLAEPIDAARLLAHLAGRLAGRS